MSHGDSTISQPHDQDYLSLRDRKRGSEVELQQALAYMVANLRKWEQEEKAKHVREIYDQEVILELLTFKHNTRPCSLPGLRWKETIMATHAIDPFLIKLSDKFSTTGH